MLSLPLFRHALRGAGLLLALPALAAEPTLDPVWRDISESRSHLALLQAERAAKSGSRAALLARAAATLDDQPVTDERLRATEAQLADLARGDDELAAQAAYLQARIWQTHLSQPDYARAAGLFRALAERQPQSRWAQLGLVKLGLLHLYALPEPGDPEARHAAAEALLARLTEPALQRDLHLQLGLAGIFHCRPLGEVLEHLLAADRIGGVPGIAGEDLIVQLGELSLRAGQYAQARRYFDRYLDEYPTSGRCFTIRARLRELAAREAAAGGRQP